VALLFENVQLTVIVKEGGRPVPPLPTVFFKGSASIAGHGDTVEIPKICQDDQADYEGELVVIIGKDAKNVSKEDALEYVLGYTAGDDVSSRLAKQYSAVSDVKKMATRSEVGGRSTTMGILEIVLIPDLPMIVIPNIELGLMAMLPWGQSSSLRRFREHFDLLTFKGHTKS
jgi:Fumarylacetoacetate (FAA) hydrolase family